MIKSNVTTYSTTIVGCEMCNEHGNWYTDLDADCLSVQYDTIWHVLCDNHKKEYDVKVIMKLRKEKLKKINNIYQYENTSIL